MSLEPFSFHLTGTPIMVAVDKLKEDIKLIEQGVIPTDLSENCQYNIMKKMGINDSEIPKFTDVKYWGQYFPEIAKHTLERFGIGYDPRRSLVTTDANPIYDRFVKWQFGHLHKKNALRFGTRYDLYSVKDSQPCLGHERSSGENAVPQKSYLIKCELTCSYSDIFNSETTDSPSIGNLMTNESTDSIESTEFMNKHSLSAISMYLIVMITRPETMYGATNIWIDKNATYNIFYVETSIDKGYWICQESNLISLIHQNRDTDKFHIIRYTQKGSIIGSELIGKTTKNPLTKCVNVSTDIVMTDLIVAYR